MEVQSPEKSTHSRTSKAVEEEEEEVDEEEELNTYALIPPNGGWGWVVVACAFYCNVVVDGIQLTFGVFLQAIAKSFDAEVAQVALAGSLMFGIHLLMGPVCAGFSRVFGLRPVTIAGSLICCLGVGASYFAPGYWFLYISFGVLGGNVVFKCVCPSGFSKCPSRIGASLLGAVRATILTFGIGLGLVYMNSLVITSVYFTTLMPIAIAIVVCGTGVGTMVFAALGDYLLEVTTWQNSFLMQAALSGSMALAAAAFKPLKPVKVRLSPTASSTKSSVRRLIDRDVGEPSGKKTVFVKAPTGRGSITSLQTMHSILWNLVEEAVVSKKPKRTFHCRCRSCRKNKEEKSDKNVLVLSQIRGDRPDLRHKSLEMGKLYEVENEEDISPERLNSPRLHKTFFTRIDFQKEENRRCDAIRRTVWAMFDCRLMGSCAFVVYTISGALQMAGFFIVYIYVKERYISMGYSEKVSVYFLIFLGGTNMFWRLFLGGLASHPKINYWVLAITGIILGGLAVTFSGFNSSIYYQLAFCCFFGLGIASFAVFRIVLLVDLVGKERIENGTGINLLFMGILCIISPPFFGWLMELTNSYDIVFITTGILVVLSGMMLIGLNKVKV